jgi:hypothetical protein
MFVCPSNSVSRGKNNLLLDDLLQRINDTMLNNPFVGQHIFDYFKTSDNEDDDTLDPNDLLQGQNDDDVDSDVDDEIIPHVPEFRDAFRSSFVVSND